jgi:DNA-binding GntR family transcriptional regulator
MATPLPPFEPVRHQTLREHAYAEIRTALMTGRFEPGQRVTIRGLADALGISPTPVREAVRRLAAEGAIEAEPNRWMNVPLLTADNLRELKTIRLALEGLATALAARRMTDAEVEALRARDAAIVALRGSGDVKAMITRIHQFHFSIYRASGMPRLVEIIEGLWLRNAPYVNLLFPGYTDKERGRLRARTLAAIARHDAAGAQRSMEADVGQAADYLIRLLRTREALPATSRPRVLSGQTRQPREPARP